MSRFILPSWVNKHNVLGDLDSVDALMLAKIKSGLDKFHVENPEVSIVIPAYNEEKSLLKTLSSLSELKSKYRIELIIANNNSKDRTQEILDRLGVKSVFVKDQGITYARQAGLELAKGKIIVSADADTIYPPEWADALAETLMQNPTVSCAYGTYSFIPGPTNSRAFLGFYEMAAESFFAIKRRNRECVNVMGFNFAYRKEDAICIGGFNHNLQRHITGRSDDGWMAYCLMQRGTLKHVTNLKARVWTSDRRLMDDGSIGKAFVRRAKKEISRIGIYFREKDAVKVP